MIPESVLHTHDEECRVSLDTLFKVLPAGSRASNYHYYIEYAKDGRPYSRLYGRYALEACSFKKIPIFLGKKPDDLEVV